MRWIMNQRQIMAQWMVHRLPILKDPELLEPYQCIGLYDGRRIAAGCLYYNYVGHDMELAFYSESPHWVTASRVGKFLEYPFIEAGCMRITAKTSRRNKRMRRCLEGMGFKQEGVKRKGHDGIEDAIEYGMLYSEAQKWLNFSKERKNGILA